MSDVQTTSASAPVKSEERTSGDRTLTARRLLVWAISFALGGAVSALIMIFLLRVELSVAVPISNYQVPLLPLVTIPMGLLFMIWIDYFMGTRIVAE